MHPRCILRPDHSDNIRSWSEPHMAIFSQQCVRWWVLGHSTGTLAQVKPSVWVDVHSLIIAPTFMPPFFLPLLLRSLSAHTIWSQWTLHFYPEYFHSAMSSSSFNLWHIRHGKCINNKICCKWNWCTCLSAYTAGKWAPITSSHSRSMRTDRGVHLWLNNPRHMLKPGVNRASEEQIHSTTGK